MITKQCDNCNKKGKNFYCDNCTKIAEYFDVYSYYTTTSSKKNTQIGRIKAYTWHDVLEYIKNNFFYDKSDSLRIDCEKDFAFIEKKSTEQVAVNKRTKKLAGEDPVGYKIYLNKENKSIEFHSKVKNFWDLTTVTN
ncbi:MAG: hypothetical protein E6L03_01630 [Thaumarchaeota archaeon]|nr:MAG: hypothetical protein E6L03_01630 [Nitrososphaerota archaeon]